MNKKLFIAIMIGFFVLYLNGSVKFEKVDKETILKTSQEWQDNYHNYTVDPSILEILKTKAEGLKIDVYLGLWCSDSRHNVPGFIKIIDSIENPDLVVNYYAVERKPNKDVKYFIDEFNVERVPTFIFYKGGKEIGRIIENPKKTLYDDFLEIIF